MLSGKMILNPVDYLNQVLAAVSEGSVEKWLVKSRTLAERSPVAAFTTSPLWSEAKWSSTTFQWHPTSQAPPIMGIVFDDAEKGKELFRAFAKSCNHSDRFEELRISIIEGSPEGQPFGYSVHIGPEMEMLQAMATAEDIEITNATMPFFGQVNRMYPVVGHPNLLQKFKQEYEKHKQFLLAPVVKRAGEQLWCDPMLGIEKSLITFRNLADVQSDDIDAVALALPALVPPRT
jgi:hypothetical protein